MNEQALVYSFKIGLTTAYLAPFTYLIASWTIFSSHVDRGLRLITTLVAMGIGPCCAIPACLILYYITDLLLKYQLDMAFRKLLLSVSVVFLISITCWMVLGSSDLLGSNIKVAALYSFIGILCVWIFKLKKPETIAYL